MPSVHSSALVRGEGPVSSTTSPIHKGLSNVAKKKTESWSDDPHRQDKDAEHQKAMEATPSAVAARIELPQLDIRYMQITIVGDSGLICHRWSEKAKKQILDKQMGKATAGKENKDPQEDFRSSLYPLPDGGHGFPAIAFKCAAVEACTSLGKSVTKVAARQAFHVVGELVRIEGEPKMREDMVRVGQGTADIRFRAEFEEWSTTLKLRYNARVLTGEQVINLFNTAGFAVGVGEWRPERNGMHGMFHTA